MSQLAKLRCLLPLLQADSQSGGAAPISSTAGFPDSTAGENPGGPQNRGPRDPGRLARSGMKALHERVPDGREEVLARPLGADVTSPRLAIHPPGPS